MNKKTQKKHTTLTMCYHEIIHYSAIKKSVNYGKFFF